MRQDVQAALGSAYRIESELGRGGMSRVFVAEEVALGRKVVVKVLSPELAAGFSIERFRREIAVTARLQHPNIVPILTAGDVQGLPYFTMPYVEGESLHARIARGGPLPIADIVEILRDVTQALAHAHERGVVHRDVKPDNVLLSGSAATVTDFGIAKAIASSRTHADVPIEGSGTLTTAGTAVGTPAYMSPEQATADPSTDHRSDLYSLGAMAYEMLSGSPPFGRSGARELLMAHLMRDPEPVGNRRPDCPQELAAIVMQCLAKEPSDRPASAGDVLRALHTIGLSTGAYSAPRPVDAVISIAILPLTALTRGEDDEYLADGITEEIINTLARLPGLRVAARTSSFAFKGQPLEVHEVARRLRVGNVLEGSMRRSGSRLRVTAQLVKAADGYTLWSERYDREMRDVFDLQDEIAGAIANALEVALLRSGELPVVEKETRTRNLDAYTLYLKGRHFLDLRVEGMQKAMGYYRQALELDPEFALAHAGVAEGHFLLTLYSAVRPREGAPSARAAAEQALTLDPSNAQAHIVLSNVALWYDWDLAATRHHLDRAIALKPSDPLTHTCFAYYHAVQGDFEESMRLIRHAVDLDPVGLWALSNAAVVCYLARRFEECIDRCKALLEVSPTYSEAFRWLGLAHFHLGRVDDAFTAVEKAVQLSNRNPWALANFGAMLARVGKKDQAVAILAELEQRASSETIPAFAIATMHYGLGRRDEAFAWFDKAVDARDFWCLLLGIDPGFDGLRRDGRFPALLARVGVAAPRG
ncbi:MAG: protein kinase domain-containing protein [Gemmatimonadaceae bacterium]